MGKCLSMKLLSVILFLIFSHVSNADEIATDKVAHLAVSYAVANTVVPFMQNTKKPVLYSFAIGMVPGLLKRAYDNTQPYDPREKNQDMLANIIGAASGALIGNWFINYSNNKTFIISYRNNF